jgi:thiol:disulfide interchange protein/DsbC/DsbD-like thiol-disulfide interchange protein
VILLGSSVYAASSGWVQSSHLKAELVSEYRKVQPGQQLTLALHTQHDPYWHSYWVNPGDSGLATSFSWHLPRGVVAGEIQWPTPKAIRVPPLVNYGYENQAILLVQLQIPADYSATELTLNAQVDWLVCQEICIPATASFGLTVPVSQTAELNQGALTLFRSARQAMPEVVSKTGVAKYQIKDQSFLAMIELADQINANAFFVGAGELVDHAAPQEVWFQDGRLWLRQAKNTYFSDAPAQLPLVLLTDQGAKQVMLTFEATTSIAIGAPLKPLAIDAHTDMPNISQSAGFSWSQLALMLCFAMIGGLILNLMPCVFPVLSLKALSMSRAGQVLAAQRAEALWYSLGVVLSFVSLAALLLVLRAGGESLGWGFQLQNPLLVAFLAFLLFALGLSLSGLVQFGVGFMNSGQQLTQQRGHRGSFFTGVLAVVVASPCTAPMMGTALGFAATQSAPIALLVFATLGIGMALPFLLLALFPKLAQQLPKPGPWMEQLKYWLAVPLYISAVWLLWVYGRQTSIDALALALLGFVALAVSCWQWGLAQLARQQGRKAAVPQAIAILALVITFLSVLMASDVVSPTTSPSSATTAPYAAEPWSAERLEQLRTQGKPVFVNMTADWCITCLVNERVALDTSAAQATMQKYQLSYLKGDWTRQDQAISRYLRQYGRDGVPLYVLYFPGHQGQVLPQMLTPDTLENALIAGPDPALKTATVGQ